MSSDHVQPEIAPPVPMQGVVVRIFGVGGAGTKVTERLAQCELPSASFHAINTDASAAPHGSRVERVHPDGRLLRGMGTGGDPERGRAAAEEHLPRLKELCAGADVVIIVTGLGGGAGTGVSPVLARAAKEAGALVLAFATLPFECEGNHRLRQARHGLDRLKGAADGVICLPNQKVIKLIDENTSVMETFNITNELLADGVSGVWRLMAHRGLIEIHFSDLCALLRDRHGESSFAAAESMGPARSREVLDKLFGHPMLDGGQMLAESEAVLVSLMGGPDLTMAEVNRVMEQINRHCERAQVIMGAAIDETFAERLAVTVVATRRNSQPAGREAHESGESSGATELEAHLLKDAPVARPQSRFVPPPPALTPEKMEQLAARQTNGGRQRKNAARLRQGQLPLEIVSKGRFDKSEPTIHKGEDLDVPTYIRRGVSLN
jgi:cell division protein FtsZ